MKKTVNILVLAVIATVLMSLVGCVPDETIIVSKQECWFPKEAGSDTIIIHANCKWSVTCNNDADWFTISPMSGRKNDSILIVSVQPYDGEHFRSATFTIESKHGHVRRSMFLSQNNIEIQSLVNKVFGVMELEHWNTDYYDQIIEDTYKDSVYDPYDTTRGQLMIFLENGEGIQRRRKSTGAVYYRFTYDYNPSLRILHCEFETVTDTMEVYDTQVLTATDSLFRFIHEFKKHWWERADMRKIGTFQPQEKSELLRKAAKKREKSGEGIFQF